jgi:hypothetical protein
MHPFLLIVVVFSSTCSVLCQVSHSAVQFIPTKPTRNGFKAHTLNDAKTGYLVNLKIHTRDHPVHVAEAKEYVNALITVRVYRSINMALPADASPVMKAAATVLEGKEHPQRGRDPPAEVDKLNALVLHLAEPYEGTGAYICTDRFYSSPELALSLRAKGLGFIGTQKDGRKYFPSKFKPDKKQKKAMKRGDYVLVQWNNLTACFWKDSGLVCFISTIVDPTKASVTVNRRSSKTGETKEYNAPPQSPLYSGAMGGSDLFNSLLQRYYYPQKVFRWWMSIFCWLLHAARVNAYILWKQYPWDQRNSHRATMPQLDFLKDLIEELIGDFKGRKPRGKPSGVMPSMPRPFGVLSTDFFVSFCVFLHQPSVPRPSRITRWLWRMTTTSAASAFGARRRRPCTVATAKGSRGVVSGYACFRSRMFQ